MRRGARRFVYRTVEGELGRCDLAYTILQPTYFSEVWLGPAVGSDHATLRTVEEHARRVTEGGLRP